MYVYTLKRNTFLINAINCLTKSRNKNNYKCNYYEERRSKAEESEISSATHFCQVLDSNEGRTEITRLHMV